MNEQRPATLADVILAALGLAMLTFVLWAALLGTIGSSVRHIESMTPCSTVTK